jgi:8-oxo-dGTP pyrophosphatase MutT (NUDIX family)
MSDTARFFEADRLDCRLVDHRWQLSPAQERAVAEIWREQSRGNPWLYDGRILLARRAEALVDAAGERKLDVEFFEAPFSRFHAWKQLGQPDWGVLNCFAAPALRSSDGAYLAGEMGQDHSQPGRIYFPCGTPDLEDVVGSRVDLTGCLIRELAEETGIVVDERNFAPSWRVIVTGRQVACVRVVHLPGQAEALRDAALSYIRGQEKPELAGMRILRKGADLADPRLPDFMKAFLERALCK